MSRPVIDRAVIRRTVAAALGASEDELDDDENLIALGFDSMTLVRIAAEWRSDGVDVGFADLAKAPTISDWVALIERSGVVDGDAAQPDDAADDPTFPLATMQHAYWLGRAEGQALGGVAAHLYAEFDGAVADVERLRHAAEALIARHPALRTRVLDAGVQEVTDRSDRPALWVADLRAKDPEEVAAELERRRDACSHQLLDIGTGQVIDIGLTLLPGGRSRLHVDVDMVASDAMSYRIILSDLALLYRGAARVDERLEYDYRTYLRQHDASTENARDREKRWWAERIVDYPAPPQLPQAAESSAADLRRSIRRDHMLAPAARAVLYGRARRYGVTPAMVLATVFADVLGRWSGSQRFLLNLPLFDREPLHPHIGSVVGDFSNSILLDVRVDPAASFIDRVTAMQDNLHEHAAHAVYRGLDVLRDLGRINGAPVVAPVVYTSGLNLGDLFAPAVTEEFGEPCWIISQGPQVALDAQVVELSGGILLNWDVRRDVFPPGVIDVMFAAYRDLIDRLVADDADWASSMEIPLPAAQREVRARVNDTGMELPARTLHGEFFRRAGEQGGEPAVLWGESGAYTYAELADAALRVASALRAAGVRRGDTVAIRIRKGHLQVPAALGVLAAGAAYLPIGEDQPPARRTVMLERGRAAAIIVDRDVTDLPQGLVAVSLDDALAHPATLDEPVLVDPSDIAYVLFTSGSTGEPKGVELPHKSAANTLYGVISVFGLTGADRTLGLSVLEFDLSVIDIFAALSLGGAFIAVEGDAAKDAVAWADLADRHRASAITCAPGILRMLLDVATAEQLRHLHAVMLGGDWVTVDLAERLFELSPEARFAGLGGTTETAVHCTVCEVGHEIPEDWRTVPYGTPLPNFVCRVVDESGRDCPDWVVGELWIGGPSVGAGYRGDPERTASRFVQHAGRRWYRTGDLARYLPDGGLDFLGRADHQVKVRGYRVELGEIEAALRGVDGVSQALAVTVDGAARRLLAVVTPAGDRRLDGVALRDELSDLLPPYMIPERIDVLERIPLTRNGKLDRRAVVAALPTAGDVGTAVAPSSALEAALLHIVSGVLLPNGLDSVDTDFFAAGGDSILATSVVAQVRSLLQVTTVTAADFFTTRTVAGLAALLGDRAVEPQQLQAAAEIYLDVIGLDEAQALEAVSESQ
ncbi:non-ribosomal peptide synthetase [Tsukamurella soli]|uniref:Phenyloxazoline synthase MbtB n=1 Tax=Tsukamurella soli TaxID=644556 RepID=A0ABP8JB17_9ACTN